MRPVAKSIQRAKLKIIFRLERHQELLSMTHNLGQKSMVKIA